MKAADPPQPRSHGWFAGAALCLLALLAYSNSFQTGFVFDSRVLVLEDRRIQAATADNVNLILNHSYWWPFTESSLYRPVTTLSYLLNYAVLGHRDRPAGYHAINLLLHSGNALLVFAIARRLGRQLWPAFFVAALWAVHPLSTEAVTNIVGRADLLAAMASLSGLLAYLRAADTSGARRVWWLTGVAIAAAAGVFSKESATAILGVIVLYDVSFRLPGHRWRNAAVGVLVLMPPLLWLWYARSTVLVASSGAEFPVVDNPIISAGFWQGRLTALAVMARYLWLVAWPARLSPDYSFDQIPLVSGTPADWVSWIVVAAAAVGTLLMFRRHRVVFFAASCAFVCFVPASNLAVLSGTIMAERLMYLPSVGLAACGVMALYAAGNLTKRRSSVPVLLVLVMAILAARTWTRNADWETELTLWTAAADASPRSFKTHGALAEALYTSDPSHANLDRAIAEKEQSLAILRSVPNPSQTSAPYREAATYQLEYGEQLDQRTGDARAAAGARGAYQRAADHALHFLSLVYDVAPSDADAAAIVAAGGASPRDVADVYRVLSAARLHLNDPGQAVEAAERAQYLDGFNPVSYRVSATALLTANRFDDTAVTLWSGFMLTGNPDLRDVVVDLYRRGLEPGNCALTQTANGVTVNTACSIVRQHMCAASLYAADMHRQHGHPDLADAVLTRAARDLACNRTSAGWPAR